MPAVANAEDCLVMNPSVHTGYEDEYESQETEMLRPFSSQCVFLWALLMCVCVCLWLRMLTVAEVPEDDDREGQRRLRLPHFWGRQSLRELTAVHTCARSCRVSCFKRGLRWIEQTLCSLFSPLYCQVKLLFFKASTWGWSFWDYVPNTDSCTFIPDALHRVVLFPPPPPPSALFIYLPPHLIFSLLSLSFNKRKTVGDKHT